MSSENRVVFDFVDEIRARFASLLTSLPTGCRRTYVQSLYRII